VEASIGYLSGYTGRSGIKAWLKKPAETTEVRVETLGSYNRSELKRTVRWWSPAPQFWIVKTIGDRALVKGADYNTYGALRALETENRQLGLPYNTVSAAGNFLAEVWIDMSLLESNAPLRLTAPAGILDPKPLR
jgi:hypothetical protein